MSKTETTKETRVFCPCAANFICTSGLSDEWLRSQGWEKIGKQWYCDECAPYQKRKKA